MARRGLSLGSSNPALTLGVGTVGGMMIYAGIAGTSIVDVLAGRASLKDLNPKAGPDYQTGVGGSEVQPSDIHGQAGSLLELIHNPGFSVKNGKVVPSSFWGAETWAGHRDHIHVGAPTHILISLCHAAETQFHLHVGQFDGPGVPKRWGPVTRVHHAGSLHYSHRAADITGDERQVQRFGKYVMESLHVG